MRLASYERESVIVNLLAIGDIRRMIYISLFWKLSAARIPIQIVPTNCIPVTEDISHYVRLLHYNDVENNIYQWIRNFETPPPRAVGRFFCNGGTVAGKGWGHYLTCRWHHPCRRGWGILGVSSSRQFLNLEPPQRYFQHLSWGMYAKNRPRINAKRQVFSALTSAYLWGPVNLKHIIYSSTGKILHGVWLAYL